MASLSSVYSRLLFLPPPDHGLCGSQFFITLRDDLDYLDEKFPIFGQGAEGLDVWDHLNEAYVDEANRPYINIRIKHTTVLDDPFDDPAGLEEMVPPQSPERDPNK